MNETREHRIRCGNVHCPSGEHASIDAVRECYRWENGEAPDYIPDEDGSIAYARMLERRAERGSWFGFGD